jgi:hypothetical protein
LIEVNCFLQDEADHKEVKEDVGEDGEDLIAKAEKEFFEALESEKKRRERESSKKSGEYDDGEEKQDRGKVPAVTITYFFISKRAKAQLL